MKQMEHNFKVTYRWWRANGQDEVRDCDVEALEEKAGEIMQAQTASGCTSGQLLDNIHMLVDDPEEGIGYIGHWEVTKLGEDDS